MRFYNPENFKKGELLLSRYYPKELAILLGTILTSVILTIIIGVGLVGAGSTMLLAFLLLLAILPTGLAFFLLEPMEGYHNAYHYFKLKLQFRKSMKKYMWEGIQYEDIEE